MDTHNRPVDPRQRESIEKVEKFLRSLIAREFFGKAIITLKKGLPVELRVEEVVKPWEVR